MYQLAPFYIELGGIRIAHREWDSHPDNIYIYWETGLDGWWGTPDAKISLTERTISDGAYPITDEDVIYSARTVTFGVCIYNYNDRSRTIKAMNKLNALAHKMVQLRVVDADTDTFATGYVTVQWETSRNQDWHIGDVTVVCPDPRRYSWDLKQVYLGATSGSTTDGLQYNTSNNGILIPLNYGSPAEEVDSSMGLENAGTATAYPKITLTGNMSEVTLSSVTTGGTMTYKPTVGDIGVVLDSFSKTATSNGVDLTSGVEGTWFPTIPPQGSEMLAMSSVGSGSAVVTWRDTYI